MNENSPDTEEFYTAVELNSALVQGELLSNLVQVRLNLEKMNTEEEAIDKVQHPFVIVVSQSCDLDWDFNARTGNTGEHRKIPNVLFCEVTEAVNLAKQIMERDQARKLDKSRTWARVKINKDERYHFLQKWVNFPELGVDFKRYFSIPTDEVYKRLDFGEAKRLGRLISPYLEHFITRFYYFQSRVALPSEHFSDPNENL